ncbi:MAG: tyrosine-type recombinase/integrase, partial [Pseudobdellovibrionaceae bacterium]
MEEKKPKRIAVHFDDEVFLYPNDTYYYRGTPSWSKKRLEFSLGVKKGASQKEIIKAKEDKLDDFKARGVRNIKDNFRAQSVPYIKDREAEAEDPTLLSQSSLKETKSIISKHLNPYFGEMHPADLDQPGFEDYCMEKRKYKVKGRKKAGINLVNHRKVLNHYMKWLFHKKVLTTLRTFEIPKKARVPRRERIVPEGHEVLSLFQNARGSLFLYITMYALMGTRSMEILHLRWDDINFEKRSMFINGMNNRTRKDRSIPINSYVFDILETRKKSSKSAWVFPNNRSNGKLPHKTKSSMRKVFVKLLKT